MQNSARKRCSIASRLGSLQQLHWRRVSAETHSSKLEEVHQLPEDVADPAPVGESEERKTFVNQADCSGATANTEQVARVRKIELLGL